MLVDGCAVPQGSGKSTAAACALPELLGYQQALPAMAVLHR